jgi:enolase-phosphatase E1
MSRIGDDGGGAVTLSRSAEIVVLDIEGTTSAAGFILGDLYDYARPRLGPWIDANAADPDVAAAVGQVITEHDLAPDAGTEQVVAVLHEWMLADVKATPLKTLQGQIWAAGFDLGEISSHFFPDVVPALRRWATAGVRFAVFSSGSVASQRPWFAHATTGDLTDLIDGFFDTVNAGPKKIPDAYQAIATILGIEPGAALFLSDHPAELHAAVAAGWQAVGLRRPGEPHERADFAPHPVVSSFDELAVAP